ncbi:MAG: hypothetical protein RR696_14275, partial [Clostridia bacterium]
MLQKYVAVNKRNLTVAIKEGLRPMTCFFDSEHNDLPFFGNSMTQANFGNSHHSSFSMAHIPGRWLNALLNAENVLQQPANESAINKLQAWVYRSLELTDMGFPACIDIKTLAPIRETDLHNLREVMHALYSLVAYRHDLHAYDLALKLIQQVNLYFDDQTCSFRTQAFETENHAKLQCWNGTHLYASPFPVTMGRYIGPLVKFYRATGEASALEQAIKLKNCCFEHVLNSQGDYDVEIFGGHTHSTTAMLSSLAQLGETLCDLSILKRVDAFMKNGLKQIAIDTGWCIEGYHRQDDVGEINNTSDIMETCIILGRAGFSGYFARAERILRAHFLPSQLLDTHFIPELEDQTSLATYRLASQSIGAFGFPCPYGHEDHEGAQISFNWDIVGGGVGGLCEAQRAVCQQVGALHSINLLFNVSTSVLSFQNPYDGNGTATLTAFEEGTAIRLRIPAHCSAVTCSKQGAVENDEWMYLPVLHRNETISLHFAFQEAISYEN